MRPSPSKPTEERAWPGPWGSTAIILAVSLLIVAFVWGVTSKPDHSGTGREVIDGVPCVVDRGRKGEVRHLSCDWSGR